MLLFAAGAVAVLLLAAAIDLLVRVSARRYGGWSWRQLTRYLVEQPNWWQTWYPRGLRVRDSVWERLPFSMKLLRTLVWLELIVLPAGGLLVLFVIPTFEALIRYEGAAGFPLFILVLTRVVTYSVRWAIYALPVTVALLVWKFHRWGTEQNIPLLALIGGLFNLQGSHWQGSPVRAILRD